MSNQERDVAFAGLVAALSQPEAYPGELHQKVVTIQTHASVVLLAGNLVYKLKKPKNFGFFDYSTPALRRHFCLEEVRLNSRLAPQTYLGVAPVLASPSKQPSFGPTCEPEHLPEPGALFQGESVIDYAVVMVRLPDEATLEARVRNGEADASLLCSVAMKVAIFHQSIQTSAETSRYGSPETIRGNWEENLEQMRPYIGRAVPSATWVTISAFAHSFIAHRQRLFASRIRDGHIRDCHGDLRLQHIYCRPKQTGNASADSTTAPPRIDIIDCIEFNARFRFGDVASEVAFLAMELDEAGRPDLARAFADAYVAATGDEALSELLPFYCCYRACVRGKVLAFQLDEPEVPSVQRKAAKQRAEKLFDLAASYAESPTMPTLLMIGGVMGTGKSTLAAGVRQATRWQVIASDTVRKRLAGVAPEKPQPDTFGTGLYTETWTERTYSTMLQEAAQLLSDDRSIILDASFSRRSNRLAATLLATRMGARAVFAECRCPGPVARLRLARRWQERLQPDPLEESTAPALAPETTSIGATNETKGNTASDGRPDLYDAQLAAWQPVTKSETDNAMEHRVILTDQAPELAVEQVLKQPVIQP